jgi:hypothetical protein
MIFFVSRNKIKIGSLLKSNIQTKIKWNTNTIYIFGKILIVFEN